MNRLGLGLAPWPIPPLDGEGGSAFGRAGWGGSAIETPHPDDAQSVVGPSPHEGEVCDSLRSYG